VAQVADEVASTLPGGVAIDWVWPATRKVPGMQP
jgi:hypothetical protein